MCTVKTIKKHCDFPLFLLQAVGGGVPRDYQWLWHCQVATGEAKTLLEIQIGRFSTTAID
jgi:hypothetical protein